MSKKWANYTRVPLVPKTVEILNAHRKTMLPKPSITALANTAVCIGILVMAKKLKRNHQ